MGCRRGRREKQAAGEWWQYKGAASVLYGEICIDQAFRCGAYCPAPVKRPERIKANNSYAAPNSTINCIATRPVTGIDVDVNQRLETRNNDNLWPEISSSLYKNNNIRNQYSRRQCRLAAAAVLYSRYTAPAK